MYSSPDLLKAGICGRTYRLAQTIDRYNDEKVIYWRESEGDGYATVRTTIITTDNKEIPVDYMLIKEGAKWMIYDVMIEGVSLIENYRTQFDNIISSGSYDELVNRLKKKDLEEPH